MNQERKAVKSNQRSSQGADAQPPRAKPSLVLPRSQAQLVQAPVAVIVMDC